MIDVNTICFILIVLFIAFAIHRLYQSSNLRSKGGRESLNEIVRIVYDAIEHKSDIENSPAIQQIVNDMRKTLDLKTEDNFVLRDSVNADSSPYALYALYEALIHIRYVEGYIPIAFNGVEAQTGISMEYTKNKKVYNLIIAIDNANNKLSDIAMTEYRNQRNKKAIVKAICNSLEARSGLTYMRWGVYDLDDFKDDKQLIDIRFDERIEDSGSNSSYSNSSSHYSSNMSHSMSNDERENEDEQTRLISLNQNSSRELDLSGNRFQNLGQPLNQPNISRIPATSIDAQNITRSTNYPLGSLLPNTILSHPQHDLDQRQLSPTISNLLNVNAMQNQSDTDLIASARNAQNDPRDVVVNIGNEGKTDIGEIINEGPGTFSIQQNITPNISRQPPQQMNLNTQQTQQMMNVIRDTSSTPQISSQTKPENQENNDGLVLNDDLVDIYMEDN